MAVSQVRPTSDDYRVNWVDQASGTANLYQKIDDAPTDDATYVVGTQPYPLGSYRAGLGDVTVAGGSRVARVTARLRFQAASAGVTAYVSAAIFDPTVGASTGVRQAAWSSTAFTEWETAAWTLAPGGAEWTQTIVNRCQLFVYAGQLPSLRISEAWVNVDIRALGTLGTPTVAGATTTTHPTVSWVWTPNADGDVQAFSRVKIFSAAQYGAGGFNPDTSPATWDSGVVSGAAGSAQVGADLQNGVTYKAYVQAAQLFNGAAWWTAWAVSAAFTETLVPPRTPTVTVTARPAVPNVGNQVQVQTYQNALDANTASIEIDATGWTALTNCTRSRTTAQAADGAASLEMSSSAAGDMAVITTAAYPAGPGQQWTFRGAARTVVSARSDRVGVRWYSDAAGTVLIGSEVQGTSVSDATGAWTEPIFVTATAPALTKSYKIVLNVLATGGAAEVHRWDKIDAHPGTDTTFTAGGGLANGLLLVEYHDTVDPRIGGSGNWAHPQLASGSDLLRDASGAFVANLEDVIVSEAAGPIFGLRSFRWTPFNGTAGALYLGRPAGTFTDETIEFLFPAAAGVQMTLSLWLRASASFNARLFFYPLDTTGGVLTGSGDSGAIVVTTTAQRFSATFTPPAGTVWCRAKLENSSAATGVDILVDGVDWRRGATPPLAPPVGMGPLSRTWKPLRGALALPLAGEADQVSVIGDDEAPPGRIRQYRARVQVNVGATDQSNSANSASASALTPSTSGPGAGQWLLKDPLASGSAMVVTVAGLSEQIQETSERFEPLSQDAERLPVVTSTFIGGVDGTIQVRTTDAATHQRLLNLLRAPRVLLLQAPEGGQRYIRLQADRSWEREIIDDVNYEYLRTVGVGFVEVAPPPVTS